MRLAVNRCSGTQGVALTDRQARVERTAPVGLP